MSISPRLVSALSAALIAFFAAVTPVEARQAQSGRIDRIVPSAGRLGERVTISGIGFGGRNVRITVGGVSAEVVSAQGNRATFLVPDGLPAGVTVVTATNPGGHTGRIDFEVLLPEVVTQDDAHAASMTVSPEGGTLTATTADGTTYSLDVPPGALTEDSTITLTPVTAIANLPFSGGLVAAARLDPDGLQFLLPVTLTIQLPAAPGTPLTGFMFSGDAVDFHPYPVLIDENILTFNLTHFTTVGAASGSALQQPLACTSRQRAEQTIGLLVAIDIEDPAIIQAITDCLRQWFTASVRPGLETARTDAAAFKGAVIDFVFFGRLASHFTDTDVFDGTGPLGPEGAVGMALITQGARNAVAQANQNCLADKSRFVIHVRRVIEVSRIMTAITTEDEHEFSLEAVLRTLCVRVRILGALLFPTTIAADESAALTVQAGLEFTDGVTATDQPVLIQLNVTGGTPDQPGGLTGLGGAFNASVSPAPGASEIRVEIVATFPPISILTEDQRTLVVQVQGICPAPVAPLTAFSTTAALLPGCVQVSVSPPTATVNAGGTVQFSATVTGASNPDVTWTLPNGGGTIDPSTGLFTAGNAAGGFPVRATSVEDSSAFDEATVTVTNTGLILTGQVTVTETQVDIGFGGFSPQNVAFNLSVTLTVQVSPTNTLTVLAAAGSFSIVIDSFLPNCVANSTYTGTVVGGTMANPFVGPVHLQGTGIETQSGSCFVEPVSFERSVIIPLLFTLVANNVSIVALDFNRSFTAVQRNGTLTITHLATGRLDPVP